MIGLQIDTLHAEAFSPRKPECHSCVPQQWNIMESSLWDSDELLAAYVSKIPPLDDTNYLYWSYSVKALLKLAGVWTAIEPAGDEAAEASDAKAEDMADARAQYLLTLCIGSARLPRVLDCNSALEMWERLRSQYKAIAQGRAWHYLTSLFNIKKHPKESIMEYFERARKLQNELDFAGLKREESEVCLALLAGLPDEYTTLRFSLDFAELSLHKLEDRCRFIEGLHSYKHSRKPARASRNKEHGHRQNDNKDLVPYNGGSEGHHQREFTGFALAV